MPPIITGRIRKLFVCMYIKMPVAINTIKLRIKILSVFLDATEVGMYL